MSEESELTKAELMKRIGSSWTALQEALDQLTIEQLTTAKDAAGWTIKDHLVHLAAWECSAESLLQGRPRHKGLGIDENLYLNGSEEAINSAIFARSSEIAPQRALAQLRETHAQMMDLLKPMTEKDLNRPYSYYLPKEPRERNNVPVINFVYGNSAEHFSEHLDWIQALADQGA
jgi:hypothetical protein